MKATLIKYREDGKTISRKKVEVGFASESIPPIIDIEIGYSKGVYTAIYIPVTGLMALIFERIFKRIQNL